MPKSSVNVTGLINTDTTIYVVPDKIERVAGSSTDKRNYYIKDQNALGMTFTIPEGTYKAASMHFVRQNTRPDRKRIYTTRHKAVFLIKMTADI